MAHTFWEMYDEFNSCDCGPGRVLWEEMCELGRRYDTAWSSFCEGKTLVAEGRLEEALRCFECATEAYPDLANPWFWKEVLLHEVGRTEEAHQCYEQGAGLSSWGPDDLLLMGRILRRSGRFEAALRCFDRALDIDPYEPRCWLNKAIALKLLGRYQDAERCVKEALTVTKMVRDWRQRCTDSLSQDEAYYDPYDYDPEED